MNYKLIILCTVIAANAFAQSKPANQAQAKAPADTLMSSQSKLLRADSLGAALTVRSDSVFSIAKKPQQKVREVNSRLDSLQHGLQVKIDSLTALPRRDTAMVKKLSRLKTKVDSLKSKMSLSGALQGADTPLDDIGGATQKIADEANGKLDLFRQNGALQGVDNLAVPGMSSVTLPSAAGAQVQLPDVAAVEGVGGGVSLPSVKTGSIGQVDQVTTQVSGYQAEVKNVTQGLDKLNTNSLEEQVANLDQLDGVQQQLALADKAKRYYDPEVAKEEALNKVKQEAVNHFVGHEAELKAAVEQMSKMKKKMPDKDEVVDLFAKHPQSLKHKPTIERLLPGVTLQFQQQQTFWLDVNPQLAYKLNGRWLAGAGWNERFAYNFHRPGWDRQNHIYGVRSFVHFRLKDSFYLKADVENMSSPVRYKGFRSGGEIIGRDWNWSYFGGLKKDFRFSKVMQANVQMLYNLYDRKRNSPYTARFNIRIGFEFPLKKKTIPQQEKQ